MGITGRVDGGEGGIQSHDGHRNGFVDSREVVLGASAAKLVLLGSQKGCLAGTLASAALVAESRVNLAARSAAVLMALASSWAISPATVWVW